MIWPLWIPYLILKAPSKICSRRHSIFFFFYFSVKTNLDISCESSAKQRKQVLTFHVNHLLGRWFTWNVKTCFLWKKKKNKKIKKMLSAAVVIGALRVNPDPAKPEYAHLCKKHRTRSVGFWRSQLIWICTVWHSVCEFVSTTLIYSAWQGLI